MGIKLQLWGEYSGLNISLVIHDFKLLNAEKNGHSFLTLNFPSIKAMTWAEGKPRMHKRNKRKERKEHVNI